MAKIGLHFGFEDPPGWTSFREGQRQVFQRQGGHELIVSAYLVTGVVQATEHGQAVDHLFRDGMAAMLNSAASPELQVTGELARYEGSTRLETWTIESMTRDGTTRLFQALVRGPSGVQLATYECPDEAGVRERFHAFLDGVRLVEPPVRA